MYSCRERRLGTLFIPNREKIVITIIIIIFITIIIIINIITIMLIMMMMMMTMMMVPPKSPKGINCMIGPKSPKLYHCKQTHIYGIHVYVYKWAGLLGWLCMLAGLGWLGWLGWPACWAAGEDSKEYSCMHFQAYIQQCDVHVRPHVQHAVYTPWSC